VHAGRQVLHRRQVADGFHRGAELRTIQIRFQRHAPALIVAAHLGRPLAEGQISDRFQRHGLSGSCRYREILERGEIVACMFDETDANGDLAVLEGELRHVLRDVAQGRDQHRLTDGLHRYAHLRRHIKPRPNDDLRARQIAVDARIAQRRQLSHLFDDLARRALHQGAVIARQEEGNIATAAAVAAALLKSMRASGIFLKSVISFCSN